MCVMTHIQCLRTHTHQCYDKYMFANESNFLQLEMDNNMLLYYYIGQKQRGDNKST